MRNELDKEEADVQSWRGRVPARSTGMERNKTFVRISSLLRARTQEGQMQKELLMWSQQDKCLIGISQTGLSRSGPGLGFYLSIKLQSDADAAGLRTTLA